MELLEKRSVYKFDAKKGSVEYHTPQRRFLNK